jgi:hypothetical protein
MKKLTILLIFFHFCCFAGDTTISNNSHIIRFGAFGSVGYTFPRPNPFTHEDKFGSAFFQQTFGALLFPGKRNRCEIKFGRINYGYSSRFNIVHSVEGPGYIEDQFWISQNELQLFYNRSLIKVKRVEGSIAIGYSFNKINRSTVTRVKYYAEKDDFRGTPAIKQTQPNTNAIILAANLYYFFSERLSISSQVFYNDFRKLPFDGTKLRMVGGSFGVHYDF